MSKEIDLLQRAFDGLDGSLLYRLWLKEEISEYLSHFRDITKMVSGEGGKVLNETLQ